MNYQIIPYTNEHTSIVANWRYEPPYDVYNFPTYEDMLKKSSSFLDYDSFIYHSIINEHNELIALFNLTEEEHQVFFGISMNPSFCGKGLSHIILPMICNYAETMYHKPLYLQVRTWNKRAIKAYENAGFKIETRALFKTETSIDEFYIMRKKTAFNRQYE